MTFVEISPIKGKISKKLAKHLNFKGLVCFYTGLTCNFDFGPSFQPTIEHLLSWSLLPQEYKITVKNKPTRQILLQKSMVTSIGFVNNKIGHAPLKIKYEIRDACKNLIKDISSIDEYKVAKTIHDSTIDQILDQYKKYNQFPWYFHQGSTDLECKELHYDYMTLLTEEERRLFFNINN